MWSFRRKHNAQGLETPDPTPIEISMPRSLTLAEQIARFTSSAELAAAVQKNGLDTFDEADDFNTGDLEPDEVATPHELEFNGAEMPLASAHAKLTEINGGMTEEMPVERLSKAQERLKGPKPPPAIPPAPIAPQAQPAA